MVSEVPSRLFAAILLFPIPGPGNYRSAFCNYNFVFSTILYKCSHTVVRVLCLASFTYVAFEIQPWLRISVVYSFPFLNCIPLYRKHNCFIYSLVGEYLGFSSFWLACSFFDSLYKKFYYFG